MDVRVGFSIIMPVYNGEKTIRKTINSVLAQTYSNWELIIVDDGSKDNTVAVIEQFTDYRIRIIQQPNQGVSAARNTGVLEANKSFITFLDSDDEVTTNWLEEFYKLIIGTNNIGFVSCGIKTPTEVLLPRSGFNLKNVKFQNIPGSFVILRNILIQIGLYDSNLKHSENWEMVGRALKFAVINGYQITFTNKCNLIYNWEVSPKKQYLRDRNRAHAGLYLYKKYKYNGVLFYLKNDLLLQAGVNSARILKFKTARTLFTYSLKENFKLSTLFKWVFTFNPMLAKKIWLRKGIYRE